jgi:hypothetical protein
MLKKIEHYYDDEGEQIDISDLKIYWNTVENVFLHKFNCGDCGKPLGCSCFRYLNDAIEAIEYGYQCNKCFILDTWNDEEEYAIEVAEAVDKRRPDPGDFKDRVKLMQCLNNQDGNFEDTEISQKCEDVAEMIYRELSNELKALPDEEFKYVMYSCDNCDCYSGYECEV